MKKAIIPIVLMILIAPPVYADPAPQSSLFFTPGEARQAEALAEKSAPPGQADIRLGAVMYYGPKDWTIWIQGERWTPNTLHDDLQVLDVTANRVVLSWRRDPDSEVREIALMPNQTYQIATGQIIGSQ